MLTINYDTCVGCEACVNDCLNHAIVMKDGKPEIIKDCFRCGHCIAICPTASVSTTEDDTYHMSDVIPVEPSRTVIPGAQMLDVIKCRRSIRHYKEQKVEKEKLEMILEAGRFSPTGSNAQSVSYIVIQDSMEEFNREAMRCWRKYSTDRFYDLFSPPFSRDRIDYSDDNFLFKGAPCVVLLVSPSDVNAGIAGAGMEFTANGLDLGMLYVGFFVRLANFDPEMREYLGLKDGEKLGACLAFGYPDVEYYRSAPRKELQVKWR